MSNVIACIGIGYGGGHAELMPDKNTTGSLSGLTTNPDRILGELTRIEHNGQPRYVVADGTPVIDKRPAIDKHGARVVFKAPMLNMRDPKPWNRGDVPSFLAEGLAHTGGPLAGILAGALTGAINLDDVDLPTYVSYWREAGARVGVVAGDTITWEN